MSVDDLWAELLANDARLHTRPDFRFDPVYYQKFDAAFVPTGLTANEHFERYGRGEGRFGTLFQQIGSTIPELRERLAEIVIDPRLRALLDDEVEDGLEMVFEFISLGAPHDKRVSHFSSEYYLHLYPDIKKAGLDPFSHYIQWGWKEGRRSLADLRRNQHKGSRPFDAARPTCLICVHQFSRSGAPIVGLQIVREAAKTHNVVVSALEGGPLLDDFRENAVIVAITSQPAQEFEYFAGPGLDQIEFAILNSVECFFYSKLLVRRDIPFASYMHEYADYTIPVYKAYWMALFSDFLLFSSEAVRESWQHIFDDLDFDVDRDSAILPQADFIAGSTTESEYDAARARLSRLIGRDCDGKRIVYGAGHAQWRKGTDIFVMAAQACRVRDPDTIFVWIGDGVNPEDIYFGVWLDKHNRAAGANTPDGNLYFLPAGPYYDDVCRAADVLFLSSRLDPLPNVVFDAVKYGARVLLFADASGFDDPIYTNHSGLETVPYGDLVGACETLLAMPAKSHAGEGGLAALVTAPEMNLFERISTGLKERLSRQRRFVVGSGAYDVPVLFTNDDADRAGRTAEREKMWTYDRRMVWPSVEAAQEEIAASENWLHQHLSIARYGCIAAETPLPAFSLHIHAYYTDGLAEDLATYSAFARARRIVVTTTSDGLADEIEEIFAATDLRPEIVIGRNIGRDILPFIRLFEPGGLAADDAEDAIWCHVHQKKSVTLSTDGDVWRQFLLTILFGGKDEISAAVERIASPDTGLVSAFDPYMVDWNASRRLLPEIAAKVPGPLPKHVLQFPVGNMFWTKAAVVRQMQKLFGQDYPWPNEPLPNDGSVFHLIERLWPTAAAMAGLRSTFLEKSDQKRN